MRGKKKQINLEEIKELILSGKTVDEVAYIKEVTVNHLTKCLKSNNIPFETKSSRSSRMRVEEIISLLDKGLNGKDISAQLDIGYSFVMNIRRAYQLLKQKKGEKNGDFKK